MKIYHSSFLLKQRIVSCTECQRLVEYLEGHRKSNPDWWCRPVPGFGDPGARLLILGLAPGLKGANRTGRPFTGDSAGIWLYRILYEKGLSNRPDSERSRDGLGLSNVYIANAVKCVPPGNKPSGPEVSNCRPHLEAELKKLSKARVVLCLGKVSHDAYLAARQSRESLRRADFPFGHGVVHQLPSKPVYLVDSYHPSRLNTNTGRLTWEMWDEALSKALELVE